MYTAEQCRQLAAECQTWADQADDETTRRIFLEMSTEWTESAMSKEAAENPEIALRRYITDVRDLYRRVK
jgi:hypothetical protein